MRENTMTDATSTLAGPIVGCRCRVCWMRAPSSSLSRTSPVGSMTAVMDPIAFRRTGKGRRGGGRAGAAAVDRGHDHAALVRGLERRPGALGGRLVDGVDHVDIRVLGQALLHRGLAAGHRALGRELAGDLVAAAAALLALVLAGLGLG